MYRDFYALAHIPFHSTPDPAFFFRSPSHQAALQALATGLASRHGVMVLFGEAGVGKTLLLRLVCTHAPPHVHTTLVGCHAHLTFDALLRLLCRDVGLTVTTDTAPALVPQLQQALRAAACQGRQMVLLLDEAQSLPVATLAQLPCLSPEDDATGYPLQIVLAGQPTLHHTLRQDALRPLHQRIGVRATLPPLTRQESQAYIAYRLARVQRDPAPILTGAALRCLSRYGTGVPRVLNRLCTNVLIAGVMEHQRPIPAALVHRVSATVPAVRPRGVWQLGLASSAALALLVGSLWLAPWQVRREAAARVSLLTSMPAGVSLLGAQGRIASAALTRSAHHAEASPSEQVLHLLTLRRAPSTPAQAGAPPLSPAPEESGAAAHAIERQTMPAQPAPRATPRRRLGGPAETPVRAEEHASVPSGDPRMRPVVPRGQAARPRREAALSRTVARRAASRSATGDQASPRRRYRFQRPAGPEGALVAFTPPLSAPMPHRSAAVWQGFEARPTTNDDGG